MNEGGVARSQEETIEQMLSSVKEALGMEVAFVSEFVGDRLVSHEIEGDAKSFGFEKGEYIRPESYCQRVMDSRIQNVIPDAGTDDETKDLPMPHESDNGSYIAVTLKRHDGNPFGTRCCLSHTRDPWLRDLGLMQRLAQRMVARLEEKGLL